jgi:dihydroorotate dehydrogenase (fumarate)
MSELGTRYLGLRLANPIIAGASDLTANLDTIRKIEEAGAGAIVLKSLFEEQIQQERHRLEEDLRTGEGISPEIGSFYPKGEHGGPREHLLWVKKAKAAVKIPVIASLNAVNRATWVEYAKQLADQGVDGLELNFFATPRDFDLAGARIEEEQLDALREVRRAVRIPLAVKLSVFYSNPLDFLRRLDAEGIDGFVLFNRFFQPDIDPETETMRLPMNYSAPADSRLPLRFAGLLYGRVKADAGGHGPLQKRREGDIRHAGRPRALDDEEILRFHRRVPRQAQREKREGPLGLHPGAVREDAPWPQGVDGKDEGLRAATDA